MTIALSISGMIGNFLGGIMLDSSGVSFMLTVGLGVSLAGLVLVLLLTERPPTRRIWSSRTTPMSEN
jgi:predicted MFS family arabinose efflux permease